MTEEIALPTFRDSSSASSARFATIASASAWRSRARSVPGVLPQSPASARAGSLDRAVDVGLSGHRRAGERLAGRGLRQIADLARGRLRRLAADEEQVLASVATAIAGTIPRPRSGSSRGVRVRSGASSDGSIHGPPARAARSANVTPPSSEIVASRTSSHTPRSVQPIIIGHGSGLCRVAQLIGASGPWKSRTTRSSVISSGALLSR